MTPFNNAFPGEGLFFGLPAGEAKIPVFHAAKTYCNFHAGAFRDEHLFLREG
jgi:hypothetical protein